MTRWVLSSSAEKTRPPTRSALGEAPHRSALRPWLWLLVISLWAAVGFFSLYKASPRGPFGWGIPYWYFGYQLGFIRRGLVGTFTSPLVDGMPDADALKLILGISWGVTLIWLSAVLALSALVLWRLRGSQRWCWAGVVGLFLASPAVAMRGYHLGLLDVFLFVLALAATASFLGNQRTLTLVICALGPFIHEGFLFVWIPLLIPLAGRNRKLAIASGLVVVAAFALVVFATSPPDPVPHVPMKDSGLHVFLANQLGQSALKALRGMIFGHFARHPRNAFAAFAYYLLPLAATVPLVASMCRHSLRAGLRVGGATLVACSILLTGWDLGRFLCWASFVGFVCCGIELWVGRRENDDRRRLAFATAPGVVLLGASFLFAPLVECYFEACYAKGSSRLLAPPLVELHRTFAESFSAH